MQNALCLCAGQCGGLQGKMRRKRKAGGLYPTSMPRNRGRRMTGKEFEQIIRISFERKKVYELDNRQEAVPELCARLLQKRSAPRHVPL